MNQHEKLLERGEKNNAETAQALLATLELWETKTGARKSNTEADLTVDVLRVLEFDILGLEHLSPANWKVDSPELLVEARLDASTLEIWVTPATTHSTRNTDNEWRFKDFHKFGKPGRYQPWLKVAEVGMSIPNPSAHALHRLAAFQAYKYVLRQLASGFSCKLGSALFAFGEDVQLMTRRFPVAGNLVELDEDSLTAQEPAFWHPLIFPLARELKLDPLEALAVYRKDFKPLPSNLWDAAWTAYIGEQSWHRRELRLKQANPELLRVLAVADNPENYPPLTQANAGPATVALASLAAEYKPANLVDAIAKRYRLPNRDAMNAVAAFLPDVYLHLPRSVEEMKKQIELTKNSDGHGKRLHDELSDRLFKLCVKQFEEFPGRWDVSLRRALKLVDADWAKKYLPDVVTWAEQLDDLHRKKKPGTSPGR